MNTKFGWMNHMKILDQYQKSLNFYKRNVDSTFRSPRTAFSKGARRPPMNFTIEGVDEHQELLKIRFDSGTLLYIAFWRIFLAIASLGKYKTLTIGASIWEDYRKAG